MDETRKQIVERQQNLQDKILLSFGTNEELVKGIEKDEFDKKYKGKAMFTAESLSLFTLAVSKAIGEDKEHEKDILEKAKKDLSGLEKKKVLLGEGDWMYMWVSKSDTAEDDDIEKGKKAVVGEVRTWLGKKYQKQSDGSWKEVWGRGRVTGVKELEGKPNGVKKEGEKPKEEKISWKEKEEQYRSGKRSIKKDYEKLGGDWSELKEKYGEDVHAEALARLGDLHEGKLKKPNDIEKGRKAEIGETRTWKGVKMQKQSDGSWKEVVGVSRKHITDEQIARDRKENKPSTAEWQEARAKEQRELYEETGLKKHKEAAKSYQANADYIKDQKEKPKKKEGEKPKGEGKTPITGKGDPMTNEEAKEVLGDDGYSLTDVQFSFVVSKVGNDYNKIKKYTHDNYEQIIKVEQSLENDIEKGNISNALGGHGDKLF